MTNIILGCCVHAAMVLIFYPLAYVACMYLQGWDSLVWFAAGICAMATGSVVNVALRIDVI